MKHSMLLNQQQQKQSCKGLFTVTRDYGLSPTFGNFSSVVIVHTLE